uniref:ANK_REP_REGION domain-containing protein n=1 Tax=Ascaris lumbricoides TaxID=6252 RepID=A0A0M3HW63_ASCLU
MNAFIRFITHSVFMNNNNMGMSEKIERFLEAICNGNINTVEELVSFKRVIDARHPSTMASALHLAVIHERLDVLRVLLKHRSAPVNQKDVDIYSFEDGRTALHYAAAIAGIPGGNREYYDVLLESGAKEHLIDAEGYTADHYKRNPALIDMIQVKGINMYPRRSIDDIDKLIEERNLPELERMVLNGDYWRLESRIFPLSSRDLERTLANLLTRMMGIHQAIRDGDLTALKQLVDDDRLASARDDLGRTPLHIAVLLNRKAICEYLLMEYEMKPHRNSKIKAYDLFRKGEQHCITHRQYPIRRYANRSFHYFSTQVPTKISPIRQVIRRRAIQEIKSKHNRSIAIAAVEDNDLRKLKNLVDLELIDARDPQGLSLLHVAVCKERHEIVEYLASDFPNSINITDEAFLSHFPPMKVSINDLQNGRAPIHYAATQQNAIYDTLVECGADAFLPDNVRLSSFSLLSYFFYNAVVLLVCIYESGMRSLKRFSVDAPSEEDVEKWLAEGDVQKLEQVMLDGRVHLLIDKKTANLAAEEFLQGIHQYQGKIDAIHKAVEDGDVRRVKSLIDRPQLATARDRYGMTPLHKALLHGQTNAVRYLLAKYPSCVNAADHAGRTALHYAAADSNGEHMIKVLQKAGGDAFIEDKHGHTPFYYRTHGRNLNVRTLKDNAVMNQLISGQLNRPLLQDLEEDISDWIHTGNIGKLEELVLNGYGDLLLGRTHEVEDNDAVTFLEVLPQYQAKIQAIHKAIETGNLRAVKLLADRKKVALCRDARGLSPLHKAIVFGRTDIAKYLVRNYPQSVNAMDQNKRTPLHYAAALRDGGYMYKVMRKAGADPNIFDCNGRPAKYYLKYPGEIDLQALRLNTKAALKQVLHNRVAPSYLESSMQQWIREGNVAKLEQLVLSGCGDLLQNRTSNNPESSTFLEHLDTYLAEIEAVHKAIKEGNLELVKQLMVSKKLALARDRHGCTPLHTAVVFEQTEIIRYIAANFSSVLNAPDYNKRTAMHYAAAARDGGHYLKILGKAGADPIAIDNEGRTPDYYRRNAVIDLKLFKERDDDVELINDEIFDDTPRVESPQSPDSVSVVSSLFDSARRDEDDEIDRRKFERLLQDKIDLPTSDNGLYLARTVAPVLTKALAEVLLRRPADPIGFISDWLIRYHEEDPLR